MDYAKLLKRAEKALKKVEGMSQSAQLHVIYENEPYEELSGLIIILSEEEKVEEAA